MPSAYQLLPPPIEFFPEGRAYPVNWDLYDAREWGLPIVRQDYLDDARAWQQLIANSDPQVSIVQIAGCHRRTLTDVWKPLREDEEQQDVDDMIIDGSACSNITLVHQQAGEDSGDNSVPLWSTRCERYGTYYIEEEHQLLPRNNDVIRATLSLIHDDKPHLPQVLPTPIGRSASLRGTSLMEQVAELRQRIEAGVLLGEDLERLFFAR
jgi:hypothetical protein